MRTVGESLIEFAKEHRADSGELIHLRFNEHLHYLSERYRRLATEVLLRLPEDWDSHANWEMREGQQDEFTWVDKYLAGARLLESDDDAALQSWEIVLIPNALDRLSDQAVRGVIVHECGHVASGLSTDPAVRNDTISEDRADSITKWWGFESELATLERETNIEANRGL